MDATNMRPGHFEIFSQNLLFSGPVHFSSWTIWQLFPKRVFSLQICCQTGNLTYKILVMKMPEKYKNTKKRRGTMSKRLNIFYEINLCGPTATSLILSGKRRD